MIDSIIRDEAAWTAMYHYMVRPGISEIAAHIMREVYYDVKRQEIRVKHG